MRNSINLFIEGKNKDVNAEFLDAKQYTDAKNLIAEAGGQDGSLVPMKGVSKFTFQKNWRDSNSNLVSVFNVIATKEVPTEDKIIYFLKGVSVSEVPPNYVDTDFILTVDSAGTIEIIMAGFDLGFVLGYEYHIDWVVADDKQYIFWCDNGKTAPKYLNVSRAIADFTNVIKAGGTVLDEEFQTFIHVVKAPPKNLITYRYISNPSLGVNLIWDKEVVFKYRYIYKDGSISAFTPVSKYITIKALNLPNYIEYTNSLNTIELTYNVDNKNVDYIEIAVRYGDLGSWSAMSQIKTSNLIESKIILFNGTEPLVPLGLTPLDTKYYDNVPLTALSQTYIEQLLSYGGYTDGYDHVEDLNLITAPYYTGKVDDFISIGEGIAATKIVITLAEIQANSELGDDVDVNVDISVDRKTGLGFYWVVAKTTSTISIDSYATILNQIGLGFVNNTVFRDIYDQENTTEYFASFAIVADVLTITYFSGVGILTTEDLSSLPDNEFININIVVKQALGRTYKSGSGHYKGIVYFDRFQRQGDVILDRFKDSANTNALDDDTGFFTVKRFNERNSSIGETNGIVHAFVNIASIPPDWAYSYQIVYAYKNNLPLTYLQVATDGFDTSGGLNRISLKPLNLFQKKYGNTPLEYTFAEGDFFRLIGGYNTEESAWSQSFPEVPPFTITGAGQDETDVILSGHQFITLSDEDYARLIDVTAISVGNFFIEIRSQETHSENIYYEFGNHLPIIDPTLPTRFHGGTERNQDGTSAERGSDLTLVNAGVGIYFVDFAGSSFFTIGDAVLLTNDDRSFWGTVQNITGTKMYIYFNRVVSIEGILWDILSVGTAKSILDSGNAWFHETTFLVGIGGVDNTFHTESSFISDYIKLISFGFGRVQIESNNFKEVFRFASLLASQLLQADTNFFGITSFPNTSFPFKDLDVTHGQITALITRDTDIVVLQETRSGRILINKDVLTTAAGNQSVTVSDNVFGQYVPYMGNVGIGKTFKSLQYFKGRIYFRSHLVGDIFRLSTDGLTEISNLGMDDFFNKINFDPTFSGIEPSREEYLIQTSAGNVEVYSTLKKQWMPSIEIFPEKMSWFSNPLNKSIVSFKNLNIFIHEKTANYSELFDASGNLVTVIPTVSIIANDPKTQTKIYESVEVAGDNLDLLEIINISTKDATSEDITVKLLESSWVEKFKNGAYVDTLGAEYVGIGVPVLINANEVLFSFDLNTTGFAVGQDLMYYDGATITFDGNIIEIKKRSILISGTIDGAVSDFFMIRKNASVEGSDLRGLFLKMTLKVPVATFFRLNSVSTFGGNSELHEK